MQRGWRARQTVAGLIYDLAGGYGPFLLAGTVGCAIGGALLVSLPPYPNWEEGDEARAVA